MRLQTILLPTEEICNVEELYFHRRGAYLDFDGYFNLFQIAKRKRYTRITGLKLSLELEGYSEIRLMNNRTQIGSYPLDTDQRKLYEFEFPYEKSDGVFWFSLKQGSETAVPSIKGYFEGLCQEENPVNIVIDICTYRREAYVCRNMRSLVRRIYQNHDLEVRKHLQAFVIDNGQTLSQCEELQEILQTAEGKIRVFPNKNAGGAGGFTRGMIEALQRKDAEGFTHILLMDDDAVFDPDTFVRLYGFLATLKPEYQDMTVGGALLREDCAYIQHASGEMFRNCAIHTPDVELDLRSFCNCTKESQISCSNEEEFYSGWWYCCYSFNTVRPNNLPLPLFLHCDDIEYCLRNKHQKIVFLNGIGVWHKGPELLLPGANLYYDIRNNLITTALHETGNIQRKSRRYIFKALTSAIIRLKYEDARLIYQGMQDFFKGPGWLASIDSEKLNNSLREYAYRPRPLEHYKTQLTPEEYRGLNTQLAQEQGSPQIDAVFRRYKEAKSLHLKNLFTFNGWIFPHDKDRITAISVTELPYAFYRKRKVFLYEPETLKGILLKKSYLQLFHLLPCYLKILKSFNRNYDQVRQEYQNSFKTISNMTAWKEHLGLTNEDLG